MEYTIKSMDGEYEMERVFRVTGNIRFGHVFEVGRVVTLERVLFDGTYEVTGKYLGGSLIIQDVHPCDLEEVFENE